MHIGNPLKAIVVGTKSLRRPAVAYCTHNGLLPSVFVRTPSQKLRETLLLPPSSHVSQLNQDVFALFANRFRPGFFLEIGANDGFTMSNTIYLEEQFGWSGILVEADPRYRESLRNRKARAVISAVVEQEGNYEFCSAGLYGGLAAFLDETHKTWTQNGESITVWGTTLARILEENDAPAIINFVSIDVEGAEALIVEQMCGLRNHRFRCGCIEYNARQEDYQRFTVLLKESGYRVVWEGQTQQDLFFVDEQELVFSE